MTPPTFNCAGSPIPGFVPGLCGRGFEPSGCSPPNRVPKCGVGPHLRTRLGQSRPPGAQPRPQSENAGQPRPRRRAPASGGAGGGLGVGAAAVRLALWGRSWRRRGRPAPFRVRQCGARPLLGTRLARSRPAGAEPRPETQNTAGRRSIGRPRTPKATAAKHRTATRPRHATAKPGASINELRQTTTSRAGNQRGVVSTDDRAGQVCRSNSRKGPWSFGYQSINTSPL
jgi:hypothetical protein